MLQLQQYLSGPQSCILDGANPGKLPQNPLQSLLAALQTLSLLQILAEQPEVAKPPGQPEIWAHNLVL